MVCGAHAPGESSDDASSLTKTRSAVSHCFQRSPFVALDLSDPLFGCLTPRCGGPVVSFGTFVPVHVALLFREVFASLIRAPHRGSCRLLLCQSTFGRRLCDSLPTRCCSRIGLHLRGRSGPSHWWACLSSEVRSIVKLIHCLST